MISQALCSNIHFKYFFDYFAGLEFSLSFDQEYDEIHYHPQGNSGENQKHLLKDVPEYLKKDIYFQSDQAPLFFLKLSKLVHQGARE